jgi:hypothetical protein
MSHDRDETRPTTSGRTARGGFVAAAVCAGLSIAFAAIPILLSLRGSPPSGGYKLTGDTTSGILVGIAFLIGATVFFIQALRIRGKERRAQRK